MQTHRRRQCTPLYIWWSNFGCLGESINPSGEHHPTFTHANVWRWYGLIFSSSKALILWSEYPIQCSPSRCNDIVHQVKYDPSLSLSRKIPHRQLIFVDVFFFTLLSSGGSRELGSPGRCSSAPLAALHVHWTGREARKVYSRVHSHFQDQTSQKWARWDQAI